MDKARKFDLSMYKPEEFKNPGRYTIVNQSYDTTIEVVGGVNSTLRFELGPLSTANVDEDTGIKLFNNTPNPAQVTVITREQASTTKPASLTGKLFCIDAGHGGKDPGAVNGTHNEKDTALAISLKLAAMLEGAGASVLLTRSGDTYPSITQRANMANNAKCTAFVSIHLNAAENKTATGFEVLVYNSNSSSLANTLAKNVEKFMSDAVEWPDRGIKGRPDLGVLKLTKMPAILVEVGFISRDYESKELQKEPTQTRIAMAIYDGIKMTYV